MGLLLIGCGYWGNNWAKTLHRMGELAAVCDDRPAITAQIKANYPHVGVYSHLTEALNHPG
ncbi:hypothetical protein ACI394_27990, partial [Klebsiella pneumoniae]|uniref:hypothetical protein n=1 Tax=Klebsiella pneumoniae TaxID=573 RepID=UPI0038529CFF